ncbi:unnamed protein product [Rodentolepis nana]|uniref:Ras-GEF domain-containing protein n=1 Tax=Rodentolepis nana TaxID=102285 RepID=A0A0R3TEQ9_RODNA|nr:unnamed protein product [Rodentolepis nana]
MDEKIEGFIQFRSPEFMVGSSNAIMLKLTATLHCFCRMPIYNIIISWKSENDTHRSHRENFLRQISELMHQYVRFHKLSRATLFGSKPNEAKVFCYNANESYMELISNFSNIPKHLCEKWPDILLPSVKIRIIKSFWDFHVIEIVDCKYPNKRAILSPFLPTLSPETELTFYGVWILNGCFLHLSIFSSWKHECSVSHTFPSSINLDSTSVSNALLRLSFLNRLLNLSDDSLDADSLKEADSITKSALVDLVDPESNSPPLSIRLADEFIRVREFAPSSYSKCKLLTISDLMEYHTSFQPTNECINVK